MALINCPECGKQNISDTALACPHCGFAVREHTESKQREQQKDSHLDVIKQQVAIDYVKAEISNCNKIMWLGAIIGILSFVLALFNNGVNSVVIPCFIVFWSMLAMILVSSIISKKKHDTLTLIVNDFPEFERQIKAKESANAKYQSAVNAAVSAVHHKCPECGSTNTKQISDNNRAFSVAVFGLASSKIGKQYQCSDCGHKW